MSSVHVVYSIRIQAFYLKGSNRQNKASVIRVHEIKSRLSYFNFLGTRVFVARVARQTKTREYKDLDARFTANLGYSHHQKSVVLDAPSSKESSGGDVDTRRIVAYVGGVDLTGSKLTLESA